MNSTFPLKRISLHATKASIFTRRHREILQEHDGHRGDAYHHQGDLFYQHRASNPIRNRRGTITINIGVCVAIAVIGVCNGCAGSGHNCRGGINVGGDGTSGGRDGDDHGRVGRARRGRGYICAGIRWTIRIGRMAIPFAIGTEGAEIVRGAAKIVWSTLEVSRRLAIIVPKRAGMPNSTTS